MYIKSPEGSWLSGWFGKRWWITLYAFWLGMTLGGQGCGKQRVPRKARSAASSEVNHTGAPETASMPGEKRGGTLTPLNVRLRQVNKPDFDSWLQKQRGKVVLVDFWATWCMPCRELFPHTVQVYRQWGAKGLVVASVSLDDTDSEPQVRQFLAQQGAEFENFLAVGPPEPFEAFQITGGAIPYLRIYGPDGQVVHELASARQPIEPADIDKAVQQALAALPQTGQPK
jgi:thiol-disulfide isomerase/thioredoxin